MKRAAHRKHSCAPILLILSFLIGCGDNDTQDAVNENDEEEAKIAAEHGWKVSTVCNSKNIIGTWEKTVSGSSESDSYTVRLIFEADGTFVDSRDIDSPGRDWHGEYEIVDGRMVTRNWYEYDDRSAYDEYNDGCYIIENGLYLNYDIFFNSNADAETMDGTWVLRAAGIEEATNDDGSSERIIEDESLILSVQGTTFEYTKIELIDDYENGTLIEHVDTPEAKANGTLRVNGNEVYTTFTSEEVDVYDDITLNQEALFGLRMSRQLIYWTTDPSEDPYDGAYIKVE